MIFATQTYGLQKEFQADFIGTIRKLHDMGFNGIEPLVVFQKEQGKMPRNLWSEESLETAYAVMKQLDMVIPSIHVGVGFGLMAMPYKMAAKNILKVHEKYGINRFVLSGGFGSVPLTLRWAAYARKISEYVRPSGCTILYHNHDDELHPVKKGSSKTDLDLFLEKAGPEIKLQIDIGWTGLGADEREIVKQYADRVEILHLKDFYPEYAHGYSRKTMPKEAFSPIGEGVIRTKEVLDMIPGLPNYAGVVIIDQDYYKGDMMESLAIGLKNVQAMLHA